MIIRTHRRSEFTILPNHVLQNSQLTWEARGMLAYLVSLPENWQVHVTELSKRSPAAYSKNKRIIAELVATGHIVKSQKRDSAGKFKDWIFDVFDEPLIRIAECAVLPHSDNPDSENQHLQRTQQTKNTSTNKPAASGGGKTRPAPSEAGKLSFAREFGLVWSKSHERLLLESRAVAILRHEGIEDAGEVRRIVAEWAAMAARSPGGDPTAALVWACRNHLTATVAGDERLPAWL